VRFEQRDESLLGLEVFGVALAGEALLGDDFALDHGGAEQLAQLLFGATVARTALIYIRLEYLNTTRVNQGSKFSVRILCNELTNRNTRVCNVIFDT
jgi:hypothetical protein